jgi:hypothetical protein
MFINPQPQLVNTINILRSNYKKLFFTSNLHFEFLDLAMSVTLGQEWRDLFDYILVDARKPLFQRSESAFNQLDF